MKKKIKTWLKRYIPAEIFATLGALLGASIAYSITGSAIVSAYSGTIGENIGFYGYILIKEVRDSKIHHKKHNRKYSFKSCLKDIRNLLVEFGFAELLDSILVRPFAMYIFPIMLGNFPLGILIGKIVADIVFYIPTVLFYELRKKYINNIETKN